MVNGTQPGSFAQLGQGQDPGGLGLQELALPGAFGARYLYQQYPRMAGQFGFMPSMPGMPSMPTPAGVRQGLGQFGRQLRYPYSQPITPAARTATGQFAPTRWAQGRWRTPAGQFAAPSTGLRGWGGQALQGMRSGVGRFGWGLRGAGGLGIAGYGVEAIGDSAFEEGSVGETTTDYIGTALTAAALGGVVGGPVGAVGAAGIAVGIKALVDIFGGDDDGDDYKFKGESYKQAQKLTKKLKMGKELNDEQKKAVRGMVTIMAGDHEATRSMNDVGRALTIEDLQIMADTATDAVMSGASLVETEQAMRQLTGINRGGMMMEVAKSISPEHFLQAKNNMDFQNKTGATFVSSGRDQNDTAYSIGINAAGQYVKFTPTADGNFLPEGILGEYSPKEILDKTQQLTRDLAGRVDLTQRMKIGFDLDRTRMQLASTNFIADAARTEGARQHDQSLGYRYDALDYDLVKFAAGLTQDEAQHVRSLAEDVRQFDAQYNLSEKQFEEDKRQFGAAFAENKHQFDTTLQETSRRADAEIASSLNQARQQTSDRIREILQNPADYLARAYAQRGETSPFGATSQADLINQATDEYNQYARYLDSLGRGFKAQAGQRAVAEGAPAVAEEANIPAAEPGPDDAGPEAPVDVDYLKGHIRNYYQNVPSDPTLTPEQQAAQARDLQLFGEGGPLSGPSPADTAGAPARGPSGDLILDIGDPRHPAYQWDPEDPGAAGVPFGPGIRSLYGAGGGDWGMTPEQEFFGGIDEAGYPSRGRTDAAQHRSIVPGFGPQAVVPGLKRQYTRTPLVEGRRDMLVTPTENLILPGSGRTPTAVFEPAPLSYNVPRYPTGERAYPEIAARFGTDAFSDPYPEPPYGGFTVGRQGMAEKADLEAARADWEARRALQLSQHTAEQQRIKDEQGRPILPVEPMRTASVLAGQGAGQASALGGPMAPAMGDASQNVSTIVPSASLGDDPNVTEIYRERGGATGFGNPVVVGDSSNNEENQELVMSFGGAPVVVLPMTDRQETIMASAAKKVPRAQIGGMFGGNASFSSLAEQPSQVQFGGQSFGFGMDRPVTQAGILQRARASVSPAVRDLFTGKKAAPLRYGFSLFSPQQMARLTAGERSELSTRLAAENVGLADVEQAIMEQYGATGARRGRRRF